MRPKLLILDLDETLVHATESPLSTDADFRAGPYHVYQRPHLQAFLAGCREHFQLAVWTSSSADYAAAVLAQLGPLPLEFVWARDRCTRRFDPEWMTEYWVKDLSKLKRRGYDLAQVVMVDDSPEKLSRHYGNLIRVAPYEGQIEDDELPALLAYLRTLVDVQNVREIEKRGWRQRSANA